MPSTRQRFANRLAHDLPIPDKRLVCGIDQAECMLGARQHRHEARGLGKETFEAFPFGFVDADGADLVGRLGTCAEETRNLAQFVPYRRV